MWLILDLHSAWHLKFLSDWIFSRNNGFKKNSFESIAYCIKRFCVIIWFPYDHIYQDIVRTMLYTESIRWIFHVVISCVKMMDGCFTIHDLQSIFLYIFCITYIHQRMIIIVFVAHFRCWIRSTTDKNGDWQQKTPRPASPPPGPSSDFPRDSPPVGTGAGSRETGYQGFAPSFSAQTQPPSWRKQKRVYWNHSYKSAIAVYCAESWPPICRTPRASCRPPSWHKCRCKQLSTTSSWWPCK